MISPDQLVSIGNAVTDGNGGWFVGQFVSPSFGLAHQQALEIKWHQHAKGDRRLSFAHSLKATTISILVSGAFITRIKLPDGVRDFILAAPGDYIAFSPGIDHSWEAREASLVITVRFPSFPNDHVEAEIAEDDP